LVGHGPSFLWFVGTFERIPDLPLFGNYRKNETLAIFHAMRKSTT